MIVVCGEALIDLVPAGTGAAYEARPGGGPLNIAVGLGRLGVDVALLARLARDRFGRLLREHVRASRVALDLAVTSTAPTTLAVLGLDAAGVAAYDFYIDGCADGGWTVAELPDELPPTAALQVSGSLALPVPSMAETLEALLTRERPRRVIAFDPNIRPSLIRDEAAVRSRLERWLGLADIVKARAEDLAWIAGGRPIDAVLRQWREMGPTVLVVGGRRVRARAGRAGRPSRRAREGGGHGRCRRRVHVRPARVPRRYRSAEPLGAGRPDRRRAGRRVAFRPAGGGYHLRAARRRPTLARGAVAERVGRTAQCT